MLATQGVLEGDVCHLRLGDPFVEVDEFLTSQVPPSAGRPRLGGNELLYLREREADVPEEQDDPDGLHGGLVITSFARDLGGSRQEVKLLVVANGRGGDPCALSQFADRERRISQDAPGYLTKPS